MSCVLRVSGNEFDVNKFLKDSYFSPCKIFHKGEFKSPKNKKINEKSGFNLDVSKADFSCFEMQIEDAINFLKQNFEELKRLKTFPGVEGLGLDFAVDFSSECFSKSFQFNDLILQEVVRCGVELEISVYCKSE